MRNLNKYLLTALLALFLLPAMAQESKPDAMEQTGTETNWYVGLNGGLPFGVSDFSSFGADKTRTGFMGGIYGGYRFDGALKNILSLEAFAKWGKFSMSERDCCAEVHYWLGTDGVRYNSPVLNMNGWDYSDLMSKVFMQQYGLQLNVNVLGFFNATRQSRWTLEVSPLLAAVGTKADVVSKIDGASAIDGASRWHLGVGGNVQAAYKMTGNLSVGIYSGMTYMTGKAMDGMPELHNTNYVWESGVKIGWTFGKRNRKEIPHQVRDDVEGVRDDVRAVVAPVVVETPIVEPDVTVCPEETAPATEIREEKPVEQTAVVEEISQSDLSQSSEPVQVQNDVREVQEKVIISLPTIYFAFNSTAIAENELAKLQEIRKQMEDNPEMKITVNGWCDTKGSKAVNDRISLKRAETVKNWLVSNGIAAERITVKGNGSDFNEADAAKARRAESVTIKCEEK